MNEHPLGESVNQLLHAYRRALSQAREQSELTLGIAAIRSLKTVRAFDPCTAQTIALVTQLDKAQVTRALNDLCAEGLLDKHDNPTDKRSNLLVLTRRGQTVLRQVARLETETAIRMARGLDKAEQAEFVRLAHQMIGNLSD
jgi:DNA-binding MarR family transcriptional regulator